MQLAHDIEGAGPPVVLLHSSVTDRRMWQPQWAPLLEAGYQVIRLDLAGNGASPMPTGPSYNDADDVMELLDAAGVGRATVVGSSFGGRVGQEIAARWPDRVSTLVLVNAATRGHPPTPEIAAFWARENELLEAGQLDEAVTLNLDTFVGPQADPVTRELIAQMQRNNFEVQSVDTDMSEIEYEVDLARVTARTVAISGGHDLSYFTEIADAVAAKIPGTHRIHLDWAGHLPSMEDPVAFNPVLLDVLKA
jgi:3-oxoadipate enol-lactonase